jgi:hypothetical protein
MREMPLDDTRARVAASPRPRADERLRAACEIVQEKAQTLEEVWPLIRFLFEPPVDDEKAWAQGDEGGAGRCSRRRARRCRRRGLRRRRVEAALAPLPERFGVKPGRSTSRSGWRSPAHGLAGIFESLAALGSRAVVAAHRRRARAPPARARQRPTFGEVAAKPSVLPADEWAEPMARSHNQRQGKSRRRRAAGAAAPRPAPPAPAFEAVESFPS